LIIYKDLVVDEYKVVVHHHNLVVEDNNCLDHLDHIADNQVVGLDNQVVDSEVDNMVEDHLDNIAAVAVGVDHNLVDHKHLRLVHYHLAVDNN
jgi:hypothetical protein